MPGLKDLKPCLLQGWSGDYYYLRRHELTSSTCELKAGNAFDSAH